LSIEKNVEWQSMQKKIKILFLGQLDFVFIRKDLEMLRKYYSVKTINFIVDRNDLRGTFSTAIKMFFGIVWSDLTFSWFAGYHAFWAVRLSKIFRKKSIVVVGGYDVAREPDLKYGLMLNQKSANIVRNALNNADIVLTVDDGLKIDAIQNARISGSNIQTVATGYDYKIFTPNGVKENLVITVSGGDDWNRVMLKGLDTFVKSASFVSGTKFIVIGLRGVALKKLQEKSYPNVEFVGPLHNNELIPYYQRAKVYCQLSMREGLPNALCEAMLCECVPVGTNIHGVKTAIGDTGFYVPVNDPKATATAIKKALTSNKEKSARKRIIENFSIEKREKKVVEIINSFFHESKGT
jgi:glycosyltransferase involved in cell wall biosynthesis